MVSEICYARVGLVGNPSDGFNGKTISFLIKNFHASVKIEESEKVEIVKHDILDSDVFDTFDHLISKYSVQGYYGGLRLLQATCKAFGELCNASNLTSHKTKGFRMSYDTNIPRMVGLSGSSAIIVACFRCLMKYYTLTLDDLHIAFEQFPQLMLDIEVKELGIAAGLQDRVVQTYGGLVYMDFSLPPPVMTISIRNQYSVYKDGTFAAGKYHPVDPSFLPNLYLTYNTSSGGESGKVHSTVKERWLNNDPILIEGMRTLGSYAAQARESLLHKDYTLLANLINMNFDLRRQLYGDDVVGEKNIIIAELARSKGFASKFSGSGGAILCMLPSGKWMEETEEESFKDELKKHSFELIRLSV